MSHTAHFGILLTNYKWGYRRELTVAIGEKDILAAREPSL